MGGLGLGGGGGYGAGGYGYGGSPLGNKKVVPTFGVSFGLPYPTNGGIGYPINPFGGAPAVNQNFGSLSPNGLNLGLVNVNPLVSFQVAKNELGEKLFKPLVNLHVTPNANIIQKVGDLWKSKKFGFGGQPSVNQHYHTHTHYPNPPEIYHPHHHYEEHHEHGYQHGPQYSTGPGGYPSGSGGYPGGSGGYPSGPGSPAYYPSSGPGGYPGNPSGGYGFPSGPQGYYRDGGSNQENVDQQYDPSQYINPNNQNDYHYDNITPFNGRSFSNIGSLPNQNQIPDSNQYQPTDYQDIFPQNQQLQSNGGPGAYADYASYNQQPQAQSQPQPHQPQPQPQDDRHSVAFPSSRRKRDILSDDIKAEADNKETVEARTSSVESSSVEKVTNGLRMLVIVDI